MSDTNDDALDMSWIQEQKRILDINQNYLREYQSSITFHFCYVNKDSIESIHNETYTFIDPSATTIPSNDLNDIILKKTQHNPTYIFDSLMLYVVDIEPEKIGSISENTNFIQYKTTNINADIIVPPSIFIFHPINCVFIVFTKSSIKKSKNLTKKRVSFLNKTKKTLGVTI